uniref:Uncharacterized protein n=1 Tax=Romanomermis culicivorax TaxID=13658 RepID=A0A915J9A7_ROMCU
MKIEHIVLDCKFRRFELKTKIEEIWSLTVKKFVPFGTNAGAMCNLGRRLCCTERF